jgi:hypothetical protein
MLGAYQDWICRVTEILRNGHSRIELGRKRNDLCTLAGPGCALALTFGCVEHERSSWQILSSVILSFRKQSAGLYLARNNHWQHRKDQSCSSKRPSLNVKTFGIDKEQGAHYHLFTLTNWESISHWRQETSSLNRSTKVWPKRPQFWNIIFFFLVPRCLHQTSICTKAYIM